MKKILLLTSFILHYSFNIIYSQTLTLNTEMHISQIKKISTDASGDLILTCSKDKTAKLWNAQTGNLLKTFRIPIGEDNEGILYACAISPNGKIVALGGLTGYEWDKQILIYIFDVATNVLKQRITGFPDVIRDIEFSIDDNYMVTTLGGGKGIRIYDMRDLPNFTNLINLNNKYGGDCYNAAFDYSGRLATVCFDGKVRLYNNNFQLINTIECTAGKQPFSLAFSPDGTLLTIGYNDSYRIQVLDGNTLQLLYEPDISEANIVGKHLSNVSFSQDGLLLIAGGTYSKVVNDIWWQQIRVWKNKGKGSFIDYSVAKNTITDIKAMPDNSFIFSGAHPDFGRMKIDGTQIFYKATETNSYAEKGKLHFKTNNSGSVIKVKPVGNDTLIFSIVDRTLSKSNLANLTSFTDNYSGIYITDWRNSQSPKINSKTINCLKTNEWNYSVDISKDAKKIVFGTGWNIYCTNASGLLLWQTPVQGEAFCINISDNDKIIIAALGDGTIRWYSTETGALLMSLFLHLDNKRWVLWSPKGYFDCSQGADALIGWHVNQGPDKEALYYPAAQFYEKFYTPNLGARILAGEEIKGSDVEIKNFKLPPLVKITSPNNTIRGFKLLNKSIQSEQQIIEITIEATDQGGGIDEIVLYQNGKLIETTNRGFKALEQKNEKKTKTFQLTLANGENKIKASAYNIERTEAIADELLIIYTGTQVAKANLYLFVIGINQYKNAKYNLNYATADATSFKDAMLAGSANIIGNMITVFIKDAEATKTRITEELNKVKMQAKQEDIFIFYYAGHGAMSEEEKPLFYLIPTDVTQMFSSPVLIQKAISASELKQFSTEIKAQKQMYILDACQSGGMENVLVARGAAEEKAIAQLARSTGTYWLTASGSQQFAGEFAQLGHGLFTYCILQGFTGKADGQNDKKITVQELSSYLNDQVPVLSKQHKGSEQYPVTYGFGQDFPIIIVK